MKQSILALLACCAGLSAYGQPKFSQKHGVYNQSSLSVAITPKDADAEIRYTTDGSLPTAQSTRYTEPLNLTKTTILRAAEVKDGALTSTVTTASYIFAASVLSQPNNPEDYPAQWGSYTEIGGTATADYEMDPEMTNDATLRPKIVQGLYDLPVLSVVSDKDNFFSHENDEVKGGIYIFTGPPVGDPTGNGWTRPASAELMGGPQGHDLTIDCGVKLHGGHGRLAEKNPKHSLRLVFKKAYGPNKLSYPVFGAGEPKEFDQLVLRCHFGNAWQHWSEGNRQKAQYTRDVWARRMQRRMGHTSVNALYVHLFINGMYWGLYNIAERVDDTFGKNHLGGKKSDIDVVKIEEEGGNHIEASEGDLEAWDAMVQTAANAADKAAYYKLQGKDANGNDDPEQEALLDIDNFIDYMLINQYAGNTDWDHHNWYAIRRRGAESQGFKFLCWDSEVIFENENENNLNKNNGNSCPTGIFHNLMRNEEFARRYLRRAKALLADDGLLGRSSVVEVWDSLYNTIATALYDEAARWGDYRRDVHQWQSPGQLYTVDNQYKSERQRLLNNYFPVRTERVLANIENFVGIDDFEAPSNWTRLTAGLFREWDGTGADAKPVEKNVNVEWNLNQSVGGGTAVAGFGNVDHNQFADVSQYERLVLRGSGTGRLRILANRLVPHGPWKQIVVSFNENDPYWNAELGAIVFNLNDLRTVPTNEGITRNDDFVHLHVLKVDWGNNNVNVRSAYLVPAGASLGISGVKAVSTDDVYFNLNGQKVSHPTHGIYIKNGKKVIIK